MEIIDYYGLDLKIFYEKFEYPTPVIKEVPKENFDLLIEKLGMISTASSEYNYILKLDKITHFIEYATIYVLEELKKDNLV